MAGTTGKWIRCQDGTLVSLDRIKCILVDEILDGTESRAEVRAYMSEDFEYAPYFVLFAHTERKVCEEWLNVFSRQHLDVIPQITLLRKCTQCGGTGTLPIGPDGADETCSFCAGERMVPLPVYDKAMAEWGL